MPDQLPQPDKNEPAESRILVSTAFSWSSPLPPPEILARYDTVLPNAAERLFKMVEEQAAHRHDLENRVVKADILKSYLGLASGLIVALTAIIAGSLVALGGQPVAGAAIGGTTVIGLMAAFLKGTSARRNERETKAQQALTRR